MCRMIFVYGSLLEGFFNYNDYLDGKVIDRKFARTRGRLYHLISKSYPAMIEGNDYVYGELITVKEFTETIKILDSVECYFGKDNINNEYNRALKDVETLEDNITYNVFVYMYNWHNKESLENENIYIPHGNWKKYIIKKNED